MFARLPQLLVIALALAGWTAGCAVDTQPEPEGPGLSGKADDGASVDEYCEANPDDPSCHTDWAQDHEAAHETAPTNESLRDRSNGREDGVPDQFFDLFEYQSPVKSQGRRGVCSIFASVAYMEHLYLSSPAYQDLAADSQFPMPDFSEQFLQWSTKIEMSPPSFPHSGGSNAQSNLRAINRLGIPWESEWEYESSKRGPDGVDCDAEPTPTLCLTNGSPPDSAVSARRFALPRPGQWINSSRTSIKHHMHNERTGVQVGLSFYYQSWNHRRSGLPTNSDYSVRGIVLTPNTADEEWSEQGDNRAGHSILLIGWDDTMEVQRVDGEGNLVFCHNDDVDVNGRCPLATGDWGEQSRLEEGWVTEADIAAGEADNYVPVVDRGFFLFKNSWGTGRFGSNHDLGSGYEGYGWLSYAYVKRHGRAYYAEIPTEVEAYDPEPGDDPDEPDDPADPNLLSESGRLDSGDMVRFSVVVPDGSTGVDISMEARSGDPDLYVRVGEEPTVDAGADGQCRPYSGSGTDEACPTDASPGDTIHILINGYSTSEFALQATAR